MESASPASPSSTPLAAASPVGLSAEAALTAPRWRDATRFLSAARHPRVPKTTPTGQESGQGGHSRATRPPHQITESAARQVQDSSRLRGCHVPSLLRPSQQVLLPLPSFAHQSTTPFLFSFLPLQATTPSIPPPARAPNLF
uniref:Uncharacterized protein n=1 Tax=Aegilops tauschii subsp. strangulata TaxID=200361 RepID=A0A453QUB1_AEGTS